MAYHLRLIAAVLVLAGSAGALTRTTYRLESNLITVSPDAGKLLPDLSDRWREIYVQELRVYLKGDASNRIGYRVEPRFAIRSERDSATVTDWVLDQGYAFVDFSPRVTLFAGKQRIRWGTGWTYTPTDRLQSAPNTLDPARYLEGVPLLRLTGSFPELSFSVLYSPQRAADSVTARGRIAGVRLFKLIGTTDCYASVTHNFASEVNAGAAFATDTGPAVICGEGAYLRLHSGTLRHHLDDATGGAWKPRAVLGASRRFSASTSGYMELYYDGWGLSDDLYADYRARLAADLDGMRRLNPAAFADYARLLQLTRPTAGLRQFYVAGNGSYVYHDQWNIAGNLIVEPAGGTIYIYPLVSFTGFKNCEITAGVSAALGGDNSEKAILPAWTSADGRFVIYF